MNPTKIIIGYGDGQREERVLGDGTYQIGREFGDIVVRDPGLSSQHALLYVSGGVVTLVDQGSTNGSFDGAGRRLQGPHPLRPGEQLRLGGATLTLAPSPPAGGTQLMQSFPAALPVVGAPAPMPLPNAGAYAAAPAPAPMPSAGAYGAAPAMAAVSVSTIRGTLIKVPDATPGLVMVNGRQCPFVLEGIWRIPAAPTPGMTVEAALDAQGNIVGLTPVDAARVALEQGQQVADLARKGYGVALDRIGKPTLIATAVLWLGWFVLPSVHMGPLSLTFWQLLGIDPSNFMTLAAGTSNHGLLSLVGLASIALPLAPLVWKGPPRPWLNMAPLAFLGLVVAGTAYFVERAIAEQEQASAALQTQLFGAGSARSFGAAANAAQNAASDFLMKSALEALGWGLAVIVIASVVLFVQALRRRSVAPQSLAEPSFSVAR